MGDAPPYRVAIVGAGPAGLFAAQHLVTQHDVPVRVDLFDRLPTPFGLLRYGVAPDHTSIRSVAQALARTFDSDRVRFLGTVELGRDVTRRQLVEAYDAVVYAVGASGDLRMRVPGEDLPGSGSARQFVAWYGGHPDATQQSLRGVRSVACVGVGNVAVDVARILAKDPARLAATDMPEDVLAELATSEVTDLWIIGRRGPQHASYTTKELRELLATPGLAVSIDDGALDAGHTDPEGLDRRTRANLEALREAAARPAPSPVRRRLHFLFWHRPVALHGAGRVEEVELERTALAPDGEVVATGETRTIRADLVLRAIGYRSTPLPDVPFDEARGVIPHREGRVLDAAGRVVPGEYVTGWIKRGATGVIGTNKSDAAETVGHLLEDLPALTRHPADPLEDLRLHGVHPTSYDDWLAIDAAEIALGAATGRPRVKIDAWADLMRLCRDGRMTEGEAAGVPSYDAPDSPTTDDLY
ncbi:FAD-dependent oxidoreductase [Raineyella sp. LH-20]|uniref:FAD-dependent oxidoreductase n=1 Tax=Raineyella sp. LH-20 TaxID=3081204 RepID=UPI002953E815|nr:FAD-dependent oxidoreductase [Raineyella sp. LH-20]WOP19218.1 FAD-dependent oxidoreductase [Raineyella sp. LH-20]